MTIVRSEIAARDVKVGDVILAGRGRRLTVTAVEPIIERRTEPIGDEFPVKGWWVTGVSITATESAENAGGKTITRELCRDRGLADTVMVER